jgi:bidirectional [NiFe] hydrogenase diaphorase subunit
MKLVLNGKTGSAGSGATVLEAARAAGIDIPAVCAHDALQPYGACRLCIVEVREKGAKRWRVVASCLYPVKEGLEVRTHTAKIEKLRKFLLELLLARSPGAPYVRDLARRYGVTKTRFPALDDDCILCGLCVRVCSEVVGANAIGFSQRGIGRKVDSPFGIDHTRCLACGACTYVCPTGAIQMEHTRVMELRADGGEHLCRYTLMGLLSDAVCSLNYECSRCEIDQRIRAEAGTHPMLAEKEPGRKARGRS